MAEKTQQQIRYESEGIPYGGLHGKDAVSCSVGTVVMPAQVEEWPLGDNPNDLTARIDKIFAPYEAADKALIESEREDDSDVVGTDVPDVLIRDHEIGPEDLCTPEQMAALSELVTGNMFRMADFDPHELPQSRAA